MTQPIHIMLDLETWGTEPGCDIRSIGACVFDPSTGSVCVPSELDNYGTFYIACDNPQKGRHRTVDGEPILTYPLTRDPRTVQWWSEQSDEAQAAFADPVDLRVALERFSVWLHELTPDIDRRWDVALCGFPGSNLEARIPDPSHRLWSHGAATDGPWLAAAYRAVGLPVPWHYRAPRDTRTAFDMAGIDDHSAWLAQHPGPLGIPHHALDDAICQARAVCGAYNALR